MNGINVLVIEDDMEINYLLCNILGREGYCVRPAYSGTEAKMCLEKYDYHIILLDLMLPGIKGEALIKEIRETSIVPIIVISAKTQEEDKINALKLGADDFIAKPFSSNEVLARVSAQLRRYMNYSSLKPKEKILKYKGIIIDTETREVKVNGEMVFLTGREYSILELLMKNPNKVFSRAKIFESVWKDDFLGDENTVNVHISNLRSKLLDKDKTDYIQTIWGIGFKLKE